MAQHAQPNRRSSRATAPPCLILAAFLFAFAGVVDAQQSEEYRVKAAFLFHFAQLVEWPAGALGDEKNPMTLCTFGKDPFGGDLESTLQGKAIGTRALRIVHVNQPQETPGCEVLLMGGKDHKEIAAALAALKDQSILTVGESEGFAKQGGMIGFSMESGKVRFDINVDAAARAKLKISSRLLLLAKTVVGSHTQ
jgi:hypothetical protein